MRDNKGVYQKNNVRSLNFVLRDNSLAMELLFWSKTHHCLTGNFIEWLNE